MKWNRHSRLEGQHAFLGASKYEWLNYDEEKLTERYFNMLAVQRGTKLHALAAQLIEERVKLPANNKTFNMYVNDAIGFRMKPEQLLYYSENCFGTADTILYSEKDSFLRIHDLKTGMTKPSMHQLEIYAALFFLEYDLPVNDTEIELRIYHNDDILVANPDIEIIAPVMDKIVTFDKVIEQIKKEQMQ